MSDQCKELVSSWNGWGVSKCSRNALKDGYCNQHHPDAVKSRQEASDKRRKEKLDTNPLIVANAKIAKIEQQNKKLIEALKDTLQMVEGLQCYDNSCDPPADLSDFLNLIAEIESDKC